MTVRECAEILGCTPQRVYQQIARNEIPHTRLGRAIKIPRASFTAWVAVLNDEAIARIGERP
jgi:excisionase family DNA binding protein